MIDGTAIPTRAPGWTRRDAIVLVSILLGALLVRLEFFRGLHAFDDFNYLRHAAEIWRQRFELGDVLYWHGMRVFIFVPIAGLFALAGVSEASATAWPIVASLLSIVVVYRLGVFLGGREAGAYAALALALLPMAVDESTKVLPGPFLALLTASCAYAYVHAERVVSRRNAYLAAAGLIYATMPWAGHLGLVFGVFFPVALLVYRSKPLVRYWPLAASVALVVLVAIGLQAVVANDPLANLNVSRTVLETETPASTPLFYLRLLCSPLRSHGGIFFLSGLGAIATASSLRGASGARGAQGGLLALGWFVATYAVIEFASTSLTAYRPLFKNLRYLAMLDVPGALLAGIGAAWLRGTLSRALPLTPLVARALVGLVWIGVALASVESLARRTPYVAAQRERLERIADRVRAYDGRTIYVTHWLWNTRVGFFMRYADAYFPSGYAPYESVLLEKADPRSRNRYVQSLARGEHLDGGLLVNDERVVRASAGLIRTHMVRTGDLPELLGDPPPEWVLIERVGEIALYEIPRGWTWPVTTRTPRPPAPSS